MSPRVRTKRVPRRNHSHSSSVIPIYQCHVVIPRINPPNHHRWPFNDPQSDGGVPPTVPEVRASQEPFLHVRSALVERGANLHMFHDLNSRITGFIRDARKADMETTAKNLQPTATNINQRFEDLLSSKKVHEGLIIKQKKPGANITVGSSGQTMTSWEIPIELAGNRPCSSHGFG